RRMTLVVACIVDQNLDGAEARPDRTDRTAQRAEVGQIAWLEVNRCAAIRQGLRERPRGADRNVDERDARLLAREPANDGISYAGTAAGHQHDLALEIRIDRSHRSLSRSPKVALIQLGLASGQAGDPGAKAKQVSRAGLRCA